MADCSIDEKSGRNDEVRRENGVSTEKYNQEV